MTHSIFLFMSGGDITMILAVALLLFGGKKLPELARGLGSGIKEFKDASSGASVAPEVAKPATSSVNTDTKQ
jgi:sec-independent protein translocase protein TatA